MAGTNFVKQVRPKQPQLSHTSSEFDEIKFVGKLKIRENTILLEISRKSNWENTQNKMVRTLSQIRPVKTPTPKTQKRMHRKSVFDELELVTKITTSSKTS